MEGFFRELSSMLEKIQQLENEYGVLGIASISVSAEGYMSASVCKGDLTYTLSRMDPHSPLMISTVKELEA